MSDENPWICTRCGVERPDDAAAARDWTVFTRDAEGNFVQQLCPGCHTREEQTEAAFPTTCPRSGERRETSEAPCAAGGRTRWPR